MPVTNTDITLRIFVDDIATILATYNRIEVFRSTGDAMGPWEEITDAAATTASLLGSDAEPMALHGKTLQVRIAGTTTYTVNFSGVDPYTAAMAASDITTALGAAGTATDDGGFVRITTADTGTDASIEIVGGTGYADLGFQVNQYALGKSARVTLSTGVQDYTFVDYNGSRDYWYRTRYRHSTNGTLSEYSTPFSGATVLSLPSTDVIVGTIRMVDLAGNALPNRRITIHNLFEPSTRSGYGVMGMDLDLYTDEDGMAEGVFVRGALVEFAVEHSGVHRRIRVPTSGSSFDLFDETLEDDQFGIAVPNLRWAERRSL